MSKRFLVITNVLLSVVLLVVFAFSPLTVSATSVVPTINEDEIWRGSWTSPQVATVVFEPTKSGFYSLNITDYNGTSNVYIEITDLTVDEPFDYVYKKIADEPYKGEKRYMAGGHKYELLCYYSGDDLYDVLKADISLCFETVDFTPYQLPECSITSSKTMINFEEGVKDWLKFTPSVTGDYSLNFSNGIDGYIEVYNANSGELVDARYTVFAEVTTGLYFSSQSQVFKLNKNTEYYFCIEEYRASSTKISISKNEKDIKNIDKGSAQYDIYGIWDPSTISAALFNHIITYTDGTKATLSYNEAMFLGIQLPYVEYLGKTVIVDDNVWMVGGKQPIVSIYNDNVTITYIDVLALTDILIAEGYNTFAEYEVINNDFEDYDEHTNYWCVNVADTGVYKIDFNCLPDEILEYYSLEIVDEKNNVVKSLDPNENSWPLVAGRNYAVYFKHCYSQDKWADDISMYVCRNKYLPIYSDTTTDAWYYDAVTYAAGRGIMSGYGGTTKFGAADGIQRQDFLVMLARFEGVDLKDYEYDCQFPDVASGSYYEAAINWGYANGIVAGYQNGKFGVGDKITREQLVTFLYRYANYSFADTEYSMTESALEKRFNDYAYINDYAIEPMLWAVENGVISGKTQNTLVPYANALRCEVAQIMFNIFKNDVF